MAWKVDVPPTANVEDVDPFVPDTNVGVVVKFKILFLAFVNVSTKTRLLITSSDVLDTTIVNVIKSPASLRTPFPFVSVAVTVFVTSNAGITPVYEIVLSLVMFPSVSSPSSLVSETLKVKL